MKSAYEVGMFLGKMVGRGLINEATAREFIRYIEVREMLLDEADGCEAFGTDGWVLKAAQMLENMK